MLQVRSMMYAPRKGPTPVTRVTLNEVAAASGVSRATVSLVLQDSSRVSEPTKERVREVMGQLGYVYDRRAANLRSLRSMTVGLVATNVRNPYFADLTMAIEGALSKRGYTLLLGYSYDDLDRQAKLLEAMLEHRVDGLVLLPAHETTRRILVRSLPAGTPHVLVARHVRGHRVDYVGADNVAAGRLIGEHLASRGHRRIAFLGGPERSTARAERERGLRAALRSRGMEFDPTLSISTTADREGGERAVDLLLNVPTLPDAIVCNSDVVAFGVLASLRAAGIEPGTEVAIASFDDTPDARLQQPPLTSVSTYPDDTGTQAAELLLRRIDDPALPTHNVLLTPKLHVRESTLGFVPAQSRRRLARVRTTHLEQDA
jgi:LacI family transcriptional regulator